MIQRQNNEKRAISTPLLRGASKPAMTVLLDAGQKSQWNQLNDICCSMRKSSKPFDPRVVLNKANGAAGIVISHCNSTKSHE